MYSTPALKIVILALVAGLFSLTASAQWQWRDKSGQKVFSDQPPPADILEKNILKRPGVGSMSPTVVSRETTAPTATAASASSPVAGASAPSGKDVQLEARKKQAEDEAAAKKAAEAVKVATAKADNCERVKNGIASLNSGTRVAMVNSKGEREIMDDSSRAVEIGRLKVIASDDCI